jgi:hypothetical protein
MPWPYLQTEQTEYAFVTSSRIGMLFRLLHGTERRTSNPQRPHARDREHLNKASKMNTAAARVAVLSKHFSVACEATDSSIEHNETLAKYNSRPAPGGGKGTLTVIDNRTGKKYTVRSRQPTGCRERPCNVRCLP